VGPLLSLFLVLFLAAGCTFGGVTPISVAPSPPRRPPALIIGEVQAANPTWSLAPMHFRGRAYDWLVKNPSFEAVLTEPPAEPIAGSITVTEMTVNWSRGEPLDATTSASGAPCPPQRGGPESRRRSPGCR
jgi:hypothetical protein